MSSYYNDGRGRAEPPRRTGAKSSGRGGRRKKKKKNVFPMLLLALILAVGIVAGVQYFRTQQAQEEQLRLQAEAQEKLAAEDLVLSQDVIYDGVTINGIALGGMTKELAASAVESGLGLAEHTLTLTYADQSFFVPLMTGTDLAAVIEQAYQVGRDGTREENLAAIERIKTENVDFTVHAGYSLPEMTEIMSACASAVNQEPVSATVTGFDVKDASFTYSDGQNGVTMDEAATLAAAQAALDAGNYDASIAIVTTQVLPEMDKATLQAQFKRMATFTTTTTSNSNRNTNIRLCSEAINGAIVQPGEEFSINTITGARTEAKGYKDATVIKNGVYIQEPGGGVCQVSSTLFNAVVRAGLEITERYNHTIVSSYVPIGEDAAIDYPNKDFKFVNNTTGPVAVVMDFDESGKKLKATVYDIPILEEGITLELTSEITSVIEIPMPTYTEDPTLLYGEEVVVTEGLEGKKVTTYLITLKDGKETGREVLHKSSYPRRTPVIAINSSALPNTAPGIPEEGGIDQGTDDDNITDGFDIPEE